MTLPQLLASPLGVAAVVLILAAVVLRFRFQLMNRRAGERRRRYVIGNLVTAAVALLGGLCLALQAHLR